MNMSSAEITDWCNKEWEKVERAKKEAMELEEEQLKAEKEAKLAKDKMQLIQLIKKYPNEAKSILNKMKKL